MTVKPEGCLSDYLAASRLPTQIDSCFFQMVMDNVPDLIWAKDMADRFIFVNRAVCEMLLNCESATEAVGKPFSYFVDREKEKGFDLTFDGVCAEADRVVRETGKPGRFMAEGRVRGAKLILDIHKTPFFDDRGEMAGIMVSARDITDQQAIEIKLKKSEERFRQMADFLPIPVAEFDFDFNLFYANEAGLNYFGYTREDYERYPTVSRLVPKYKTGIVQSWIDDLRQGKSRPPFEMQFVRKDGSFIYGVINAAPIEEEGEVVAIRACFTDLSDRRNAEIALRENETRFRTLFNGFNDAIFVHPYAEEGFGPFVEVNDVACEWYGYSRDELLSMTPQALILDPEGKGMGSRESRANLKKVGKRTIETLNRRKNGEIFPVEISSSLFEFHGEQMILSTVRDITERRQSEKERADAIKFAAEQEKYALVGQVAGKMAHDFNNILGVIMGNAELALAESTDREMKRIFSLILGQTHRGKNL
ncbi:MAG: PAS domain S-box protein, partial [Desulfobacterales bacterium]|nr:PAS domain S-box protein [Desulfobacterales bacterium]